MHKHPISLLASFVLGAIFTVLVSRALGPKRPTFFGSSASGTAPITAPAKPPAPSKVLVALSTEGATPQATEPSPDPIKWLRTWVAAGAPIEQGDEALRMVKLWVEVDARSALEFVSNASRFPGRQRALVVSLVKFGEGDPASTVNWMTTHLTLEDRTRMANVIARQIGEKNLISALEFAFVPNLTVSRQTLAYLISELVRTQPTQALAYFGKLSEGGRLEAAGAVAGAMFKTDREAAVQWCVAQRGTAQGQAALRGLTESVALIAPEQLPGIIARLSLKPEEIAAMSFNIRTPDAALALLPYLSDRDRSRAVEKIIVDEIQRDPALALKLAQESLSADASRNVIKSAWEKWEYSDAKAARSWAATIQDPELKFALLGAAADPLLQMNPAQFLVQAEQRVDLGSIKSAQVNMAILNLADEDPQTATAWIDRMSQTVSSETIQSIASSWMVRDEQAAWRWINSLQSSTTRDAALSGAIEVWVVGQKISQATAALAAVSDVRSQTALRWTIVQTLNRRDPENARRWIEAQPINNEVKASWLIILENEL